MEYTNSQMRDMIREHIHSERDRKILFRRFVDGVTYEALAIEFNLSDRQIRSIVHKHEEILFKNFR